MEASPFLIGPDASGEALHAIGEREQAYSEAWLQDLIRRHPAILPTGEIEPVFRPLLSIGCEVGTAAGSIDNLFISPRGYLVLVETKLWRNPEARREVVAQAIDYASCLSRWSYDQLDAAARDYFQRYDHLDVSLLDRIEQIHGPSKAASTFLKKRWRATSGLAAS